MYHKIGQVKLNTTPEALASQAAAKNPGYGDLTCFAEYLKHGQGLKFRARPNYYYLKSLFINYMKKSHIVYDGQLVQPDHCPTCHQTVPRLDCHQPVPQ